MEVKKRNDWKWKCISNVVDKYCQHIQHVFFSRRKWWNDELIFFVLLFYYDLMNWQVDKLTTWWVDEIVIFVWLVDDLTTWWIDRTAEIDFRRMCFFGNWKIHWIVKIFRTKKNFLECLFFSISNFFQKFLLFENVPIPSMINHRIIFSFDRTRKKRQKSLFSKILWKDELPISLKNTKTKMEKFPEKFH